MKEFNDEELNNVAGGVGSDTNDIPETYTVVEGDTLPKIAAKFGTTWQELYELNKEMIDRDAKAHGVTANFENYIYPGQKLKLPKIQSTNTNKRTYRTFRSC